MGHSGKPMFIHKTNEDGSLHSYCSRCFATVTDSSSAPKVEAAEKEHKCDPRLLEMVELYRKYTHMRSAA